MILAEALSRSFVSGAETIPVLSGVDLHVPRGGSVAIVGPSGSGKSTLLGLLAGMDAPSSGRVVVDGTDLRSLSEDRLAAFRARTMGFVFQSYRLLPALTALENVMVPLELARRPEPARTAREWLARVGLGPRARHRPAQLSGGEQQRVALARAMAAGPSVLFADEPVGNLDEKNARQVGDLLFALVSERGTTLVVVTHDRKLAARAGRAVELSEGRLSPAP